MCKAAMAHLRSILGGTSAALRVVGSDSIRAGSCSCMRWISFRSFFYRGHQLRQGVSDLREPHLGQMMTYGAGGHGDLTALLQLSCYGLAGSSPAGHDIHGELLDKLGFDRGGDTVILLLPLSPVQSDAVPSDVN